MLSIEVLLFVKVEFVFDCFVVLSVRDVVFVMFEISVIWVVFV